MASLKAATALLTAESFMIAAIAFVGQREIRELISDIDKSNEKMDVIPGGQGIGVGMVFFVTIGFSFSLSLGYLHAAEYPNGFVASNYPPRWIFNSVLITLLIIVHSCFIIASRIQYINMINDAGDD